MARKKNLHIHLARKYMFKGVSDCIFKIYNSESTTSNSYDIIIILYKRKTCPLIV